jgi:alpha-tubulin suppressor-like RCC1 family protein
MTNTPAAVSGLASGVSSLGGGYSSTCVVTAAGAVLCWGDNMYGQLGDGTTTSRDVPTQVKGLTSGAKAVASGLTMSCALMTSGGVKCWGTNPQGQLGNGGTTNSATPVDVTGLGSAVSAISAGANHMCAILSATGGVQCWGANDQGQLGDSSLNDSSVPVSVPGLASGVKGVAAGNEHTCALLSSGAVSCWGNNMYGQLGDGTKTYKTTPTAVTGLGAGSGVVTITTGNYQSCALMSGGTTQCWGFNGTYGQFGNNSMVNSTSPIGAAILPSGTASIALGGSFFACGVNTIGRPYCWGWNDYGQLGDNAAEMVSLVPVAVSEP